MICAERPILFVNLRIRRLMNATEKNEKMITLYNTLPSIIPLIPNTDNANKAVDEKK